MEEERQRAKQAQMEQAVREKARAEAAAQREKEQAARRAEAAAERARAEKRRQESERKAEMVRQRQANVARYHAALDRFDGTMLDLLAAAPDTDVPAKVAAETWFSCVVPGSSGGVTLYEVKALPGKNISVTFLDASGAVETIPLDEFNRRLVNQPFLLAKGGRCYYRSAGKGRWEMRVPVPSQGETLDPSRADLRDLYAFVHKWCRGGASFSYEVFFRDVGGGETRVCVVPFGDMVRRQDIVDGLKSAADHALRKSLGAKAMAARLNEGSIIVRRKGRYK